MKPQKNTLWCLLLFLQIHHSAQAQSEIDFKKMADLVVEVIDDQEKPIAGARVYPYAMRGAEGGGHGYWNEDLIGPPKTVVTDATGKAVIQYPVHIGSSTNPLTTSLVTFQVQHTDFVQQVVHFSLGPATSVVTLKPGCEVQLSSSRPRWKSCSKFCCTDGRTIVTSLLGR